MDVRVARMSFLSIPNSFVCANQNIILILLKIILAIFYESKKKVMKIGNFDIFKLKTQGLKLLDNSLTVEKEINQ